MDRTEHRVTTGNDVNHYRLAQLAIELTRIHWSRAGYCDACGGQYPCATIRALHDAVEATP